MAQKRESKLWKRIKNLNLNAHIFRVESNTINGIPDVHCIIKGKPFWLELKSNDLKNYGISKWQINWHSIHNAFGGNAYILLKALKHKGLKLLRVDESGAVRHVARSSDDASGLVKLLSTCASS